MTFPNKDELENLGFVVALEAQNIFKLCDAESDFCIRNVGDYSVFGKRNRLIFNSVLGFFCDENKCSKEFINKFNDHYNNRKNSLEFLYQHFIESDYYSKI